MREATKPAPQTTTKYVERASTAARASGGAAGSSTARLTREGCAGRPAGGGGRAGGQRGGVAHAVTLGSRSRAVKVEPSRQSGAGAAPPRRRRGATVAPMSHVAARPPPAAPLTRADCEALDRADPLRALRDEFVLPEGVVYLDGNSLGALPRRAAARLAEVAGREWGEGLIRSWNSAGWIDLPQRIGDKIAALIGARPGEVIVADSTSLNLYK